MRSARVGTFDYLPYILPWPVDMLDGLIKIETSGSRMQKNDNNSV